MSGIDLLFAGDLILDCPNPDRWLSGIAPALRKAHVAIGHLEVPHTRSGQELQGDVPAPGADPDHIAALARVGFSVVSLAGNHIADCGAQGIADTIAALDHANIRHTGADLTLERARTPVLLKRDHHSLAFLSYNCVGPENSWATDARAGCAYVRVETIDGAPISPAATLDKIDPDSLAEMARDVQSAKSQADIVIVALHKGIVHTPATLATYEQPLAHTAIDAGADIVVGHHAHIVRGIESYRGKPIFHGLGNGCVVTTALSPYQSRGSDEARRARAEWARRRRELFGFEPDPAYELAPFHPEAVNAMLGCVHIEGNSLRVGFIPVYVEPPGRPVIANPEQARCIIAYIEHITCAGGLPRIHTTFDGECAWLN
jgi:poly-gamma-glutamate capsule biosynthesis protein CapA/YwtB (metallophosphatase superfamily)